MKSQKRKLFLHVGMDKTGTSSIQKYLYLNREENLEKYGLYYPETGIWNDFSHHNFVFMFLKTSTSEESIAQSQMNSNTKENRKLNDLISDFHIETNEKASVILSSELLFKIPRNVEGRLFIKNIIDGFDEICVIIYVRRQDDWIESRHRHSVISDSELSISDLQKPFFSDYSTWVNYWYDLVGKQNVVIRKFEQSSLYKEDIIKDFFFVLGIEDEIESTDVSENTSIGNIEYEVKKYLSKSERIIAYRDVINQFLIEHTKKNTYDDNRLRLLSFQDRYAIVDRSRLYNDKLGIVFDPPSAELVPGSPGKKMVSWKGINDENVDQIDVLVEKLLMQDAGVFNIIINEIEVGALEQTMIGKRFLKMAGWNAGKDHAKSDSREPADITSNTAEIEQMTHFKSDIHPSDHMVTTDLKAYFRTSESGLTCVLNGLSAANVKSADINSVLDFGSGYGRVFRALAYEFPHAKLTACDLMEDAARFCAETFGGDWIKSTEDLKDLKLPRKYDLTWLGSVYTHLPVHRWCELTDYLASVTNQGGLVVFTTHGQTAIKHIEDVLLKRNPHAIDRPRFDAMRRNLGRTGFDFIANKPAAINHQKNMGMDVTLGEYGFSFATEQWVSNFFSESAEWRLVKYAAPGWAGNHDSVTIQRI